MNYYLIVKCLCNILISAMILASCNMLGSKKNVSKIYFLPPGTTYKSKVVNGYKMFYREAGDLTLPTIILLHGYPSSSHTYRNLIPMLSRHYHVIAPDNLGSGLSDHPSTDSVTYTFDLLSRQIKELIDELEIDQYILYMQDFGAPVGYRMMMKEPKRIKALIVQNANAYLDGLTPKRQEFFRTAQTDTSEAKVDFLYTLTSQEAIINKQYLNDLDSGNYHIQSPDAWIHDLAF